MIAVALLMTLAQWACIEGNCQQPKYEPYIQNAIKEFHCPEGYARAQVEDPKGGTWVKCVKISDTIDGEWK